MHMQAVASEALTSETCGANDQIFIIVYTRGFD